MARIVLDNISKEFPGRRGKVVRAIEQLKLEIADGELLTLVGPSGCGKTTLLRLVAGLDQVTSGTISFNGEDVTRRPPQDRNIAMVFQRDALLPHLTARENITLGLKLRGHSRTDVEQRVTEAAAFFQLDGGLDRLPRALSGGERQRAALARAFVRRPDVFLLDEPLASLDAPLRVTLQRQIQELHRRLGATLIHVTHDQAEAMALGHRVAVMDGGRLQQVGDPASLYRSPANAFVAGFIGSPPMNLFRGTVSSQGGALWFNSQGAAAGLSLCLTDRQRALVGQLDELILGIRAEDIVDPASERPLPYGCEVEAVANSVEFLGADALVRWACGSALFATRVPSAGAPPAGLTGRLVFDMAQARFFSPDTGAALSGD